MSGRHYPGPLAAIVLVIGACALTVVGMILQTDPGDTKQIFDPGKFGVAQALGFGLAATLAARLVPEPQAERLGLRTFAPRYVPVILALIPMTVVLSEIDNWIGLFAPPIAAGPEQAEDARAEMTLLSTIQIAIALIGIKPVVEEWLFRGVILQGAVAHLGRASGLIFTSALCSLVPMPLAGSSSLASMVIASFLGAASLGILRIATGSLLAPILLHASWNAIGLTLTLLADDLPIQGYNVPEGHTPLLLLLPCLLAVAWALATSVRGMAEHPVVLDIVEVEAPDEDEDGPGGFF